MSYYNLGMQHAAAHAPSSQFAFQKQFYRTGACGYAPLLVGGVLDEITPNRVLRDMDLFQSDLNSANHELELHTGIADDHSTLDDPLTTWVVRGPWAAFRNKWIAFYAKNKEWMPRFMSGPSIYERVQEFRKEFLELRDIAKTMGMSWGGAVPQAPREVVTPSDLMKGIGEASLSIFKYAMYGVVIVGGVLILVLLLK